MFCEKCGREIPEDSIYCNYCGVKLPPEVRAADWEEAARLREEREARLRQSGAWTPENAQGVTDSDCVLPGAPKKQCPVCGRVLPASTIGELCALCEMRQNQEDGKRADEAARLQYEQEVAEGKRSRYDVSDEYDWRVFDAREAPRPATAERQKKAHKIGCMIALIPVVVIILIAVFQFISIDGTNEMIGLSAIAVGHREPEAPPPDYPAETAAVEIPAWDMEDWEDERPLSVTYTERVHPLVQGGLEAGLSFLDEPHTYLYLDDAPIVWQTLGVWNRVSGNVVSFTEQGDRETLSFDMIVIADAENPGAGFYVALALDDEILFDYRDGVDLDGFLTDAGAELYDGEAGTYFDGIVPWMPE